MSSLLQDVQNMVSDIWQMNLNLTNLEATSCHLTVEE